MALREIEFDRATGKLSDADYDELKARYTARAIDAMRSSARGHDGRCGRSGGAGVSRAHQELRALRPASRAGRDVLLELRELPARAPAAAAAQAVTESGAAFCTSCGRQLAA